MCGTELEWVCRDMVLWVCGVKACGRIALCVWGCGALRCGCMWLCVWLWGVEVWVYVVVCRGCGALRVGGMWLWGVEVWGYVVVCVVVGR